ncbi:AMP-binding protein [Xinfangfangia pollutisoli]|uniref:AMP-binding protein n=1 Tax=Xinfangfangia pollutisoli TaxID=2865960 RepID=UPI001CD7AC6F|nr:AMP-binding protein [Xinfangfangia pollutisoli]
MTFGAMQTTLGELLAEQAARFGDKPLIRWEGEDFSYAFADGHADRVATRMAAELGIAKGQHIALFLGNSPQFVWTIFALARLGAVAVPLNTAAKGELLRYFLENSHSRILIVDHEHLDRVLPVLDQVPLLERVVIVGARDGAPLPEGMLDFSDLETGPAIRPAVQITPRDPMYLMYTSGTTGPSKGVISPHSQGISVGSQLHHVYRYTEADILYTCLPLFHGNALWYSFMPALCAGATLAISRRFSASRFWDEVADCGATQTNVLGAMANIVIKEIDRADTPRIRLRQMMVVPALSAEVARPLTERFGVKITSLFAQTETFAVTLYGPDEGGLKLGSAGRVYPYVEVAILDEEDNRLPPGTTGEIALRPSLPGIMMTGYYGMPEATLEAMGTLWLHTGDRGYLDEDNYLYFVDRKKDAIRRRGENISAYELEMILSRHPSIRETAAVAVKSDLGEDDVLCFVVAAEDATIDFAEVIRFCDRNMPYFMVPRYLHVLEALPKTSSEKIEKYRLRDWANANLGSLWDREAAKIVLTR